MVTVDKIKYRGSEPFTIGDSYDHVLGVLRKLLDTGGIDKIIVGRRLKEYYGVLHVVSSDGSADFIFDADVLAGFVDNNAVLSVDGLDDVFIIDGCEHHWNLDDIRDNGVFDWDGIVQSVCRDSLSGSGGTTTIEYAYMNTSGNSCLIQLVNTVSGDEISKSGLYILKDNIVQDFPIMLNMSMLITKEGQV